VNPLSQFYTSSAAGQRDAGILDQATLAMVCFTDTRADVDSSLSLSEFYSCRPQQWLWFRDNHDTRSSAIRKDHRPLADCARSALAGRIWNISEAF
jgi:hypothetical protein